MIRMVSQLMKALLFGDAVKILGWWRRRVAKVDRILTRRELNRALLERQLLLERRPLTPVRAVERLAGLQAQSTTSPYLSLWARLEPFARDDLTRAMRRNRLVKALVQRGTLHLLTPRDYWAFSTARRELGGILWPPSYEARLPAARIRELARLLLAEPGPAGSPSRRSGRSSSRTSSRV